MTITRLNATWDTAQPGETLVIPKPSGLANGDLLILFLYEETGAGFLGGYGDFPSFTHFATSTPGGCVAVGLYRKITNAAGEPANYTFYMQSAFAYAAGAIAAYRGTAQANPINNWNWYASTGSNSQCYVADVAVLSNSLVATFNASRPGAGADVPTFPPGWTQRLYFASSYPSTSIWCIDKIYSAAGYTGQIGYNTANPATDRINFTVSLADGNNAPNAPTLNSPINSATIDRTAQQRFSWTFSDPDTSDAQSYYELRYKIVSDSTWTTVSNMVPAQFHDFAGSTFAVGSYEWQVRTKDQGGLFGPWSGSGLFSASTPPSGPTITAPTNGGTVSGTPYTVTWSVTDQQSYQIRTVADNAGNPDTATVYQDTGEITNASDRSYGMTFAVNGRFEHVQVRVKLSGLWSNWASVRVNVSYTPPAIPTFTMTAQDSLGAIDIIITNPTPTGGQPSVLYNEVWIDDGFGDGSVRKVSSATINSTWRYWTPVSGRLYDISNVRVKAVGSNGSVTWSSS